jgi:hypothetical protein
VVREIANVELAAFEHQELGDASKGLALDATDFPFLPQLEIPLASRRGLGALRK